MARTLQPCGTPAAYKRHLRRRQVPCDPCNTAWAEDAARRRGTPTQRQRQNVAAARRMAVLEALAGFDRYPTGRRGAA